MTRTLLAKAALVVAFSMSAQAASAMDNPIAESRAKIAMALGKHDTAKWATPSDRRGKTSAISFSADRMLNRYEKAQMRIRANQPHPSGGR